MLERLASYLINDSPFDIKIHIKYDHKINTTSLKRKRRWWGLERGGLAIKGHVWILVPLELELPWSFAGCHHWRSWVSGFLSIIFHNHVQAHNYLSVKA